MKRLKYQNIGLHRAPERVTMTINTYWSASSFSSGLRSHLLESNYHLDIVPMERGPLMEVANHLIKLNMYPYFEGVHGLLTALYIRSELGPTAHKFSRRHPFSCWASTMLSFFSGSLLANFFLAEPLTDVIKSSQTVTLATLTWYIVFYSPFDIVYRLISLKPCYILLDCAREILRAKVIYSGVTHTARIYPGNYVIIIFIGALRASGGCFLRPLDRLFRGVWTPNIIEMLNPSYPTKTALLASAIFTANKQADWINISTPLVYLAVVTLLIYLKFSSLTFGFYDPFRPVENLISSVLFGNAFETLEQTHTKSAKNETDKMKGGVGVGSGDKMKRGDAKKKE